MGDGIMDNYVFCSQIDFSPHNERLETVNVIK